MPAGSIVLRTHGPDEPATAPPPYSSVWPWPPRSRSPRTAAPWPSPPGSRPPPDRASIRTIRSGSTTTAPSTRRRRCRPRPATSTTSSSTRSCRPASASIAPALNVNTLDEVPDSSWFTNRIGRQRLSREALVRGPRSPRPAGHPGLADRRPARPRACSPAIASRIPEKHLWQIEFDPPANPEMASGAEVIGTAIYHALGYHVVEVYITDVDPAKIRIAPNARMRVVTAPKGVRSFVQRGPQRGAGPRRAPSRRPRPRPRQPLRRGIAARQLPLRRASGPTIPTTSSRTSTGASCAPTASSRPG